ncbi:MAG: hypothetical protein H8E14_01715 [Candidatus Marinimicrobia bacterium]|nr:hypothetical protein [Candidatus Neomarinimicrobiota bacterium]
MKKLIILLMILSVGLLAQDFDSLIAQADAQHELDAYDAVFKFLKEAEAVDAESYEVIWRLARAHFDFSDNTTDEAEIEKNLYAGFEYAEKALKIGDDRAESHKWYGILIGRVGEIEGTEQKIKNSYAVAEHTRKAIELDPEDSGNYHVMGRWHFTLADLSWFERTIASIVYATPPEASFEEARGYFKQAIVKDPEDIRNYLWLGKTLEELDDEDGAGQAYKQALGIEASSDSDKILQEEARELLEDL